MFLEGHSSYHHLVASWMFSVVHVGAWIGHLRHIAPHQLCSPNQPTTTNCTHKRCETMVQCRQCQLELEFWNYGCPQTSHPHCPTCVQFLMLTGEWNDDCFLYYVLSYQLRTSSPSSLSPWPCLPCQCQKDNWFYFFSAYLQHRTIVQNCLLSGFTTNSITQWFPVASCKENPPCFDGKVLFVET